MKKNFKKAMLLTLTVVGMGMFNSCKDHDLCEVNNVELEILKDKNAKLEDVVKAQTDKLQELADQIADIKQCECEPLTEAEVEKMINDAINNKLSSSEFTALILDIINQMGFQTKDQVIEAIEKYMTEHPNSGLTADDVEALINAAIDKLGIDEKLGQIQDKLDTAITTATEAINKNTTDIETNKAELAKLLNELENVKTEVIGQLTAIEAQLESLKSGMESLKGEVNDLTGNLDNLKAEVDALKTQLAETLAVWGPKVEEAITTANIAKELAEANNNKITALQESYEQLAESYKQLAESSAAADAELKAALESLASEMEGMANEMKNFASKEALRDVLTAAELMHAEAIAYTKQVEDWAAQNFGELQEKYTALEANVSEIQAKVDEIYPVVKENEQAIKAMQGFLNKLITNIIVQRVSNPVFGSFAFPWGMESNILMGYYGESDNQVYFPTRSTANYIYKENALTKKDAEMLGQSVESYYINGQSTIIDDVAGNAGKVYLTINPTSVDFEGTTFSLVNSQDEESPVKLGELTKSEEVLKFGVNNTRAAENGFYEAPASFDAENIPVTGVDKQMIASNLKAIAKDVLNHQDGINVKEAAKRLFNVLVELDCDLEANGVKAAWSVDGEDQSVYSKYDVAAFAVKPLSYAFLYDTNFGTSLNNKIPNLPTINPITEAMIDDILDIDKFNYEMNIDLSGLNFVIDDIDVEVPAFSINFTKLELNDLGNFTAEVTVPNYKVENHELVEDGVKTITTEVDASQLKAELELAINQQLIQNGMTITEDIRKQIEDSLNEQVDDAIASIQNNVNDFIQNEFAEELNGKINHDIQKALEEIKDQIVSGTGNYVDKANSYIDKLNYWTGRFNGYMSRIEQELNNLNARLQVTMLYYGGNGMLHQLSNSKNYPTVFSGEGVANVIATSYTGEIIAPAVKKFIGVTNVFKDDSSAQDGCVDCKAALDAVNGGEYFNKVITGSRYGIAIENMKKGYTYEIFYSGLDFSGKISARKFYVTVK